MIEKDHKQKAECSIILHLTPLRPKPASHTDFPVSALHNVMVTDAQGHTGFFTLVLWIWTVGLNACVASAITESSLQLLNLNFNLFPLAIQESSSAPLFVLFCFLRSYSVLGLILYNPSWCGTQNNVLASASQLLGILDVSRHHAWLKAVFLSCYR